MLKRKNAFYDHVFEKFCTKSARKLSQLDFDFGTKLRQFGIGTLIKNKIKFSSYLRKFR
jgi:hypothetical protein